MPREGADAQGSFDGAYGLVFGSCLLCLAIVIHLRLQNPSHDDLRRMDQLRRKVRVMVRLQKARAAGFSVVFMAAAICCGYGWCFCLLCLLMALKIMKSKFPLFSPSRLLLEARFGIEHFINETAAWFDGLQKHKVTGRFRLRDWSFFFNVQCFDWSTVQTVVTYGSDGKYESSILQTIAGMATGPSATLQIFSYCLKPLHRIGEIANFQQYVEGMVQGGGFILSKKMCRRPLDMGTIRSFPEDIDLLIVNSIPEGEDRLFLEKILKDTGCQFQIGFNPMSYDEVCWVRRINLALGKGSLVVNDVSPDWNPKIYLISLPVGDEVLNDFVFSERIMIFLTRFFNEVNDMPIPRDDVFDNMRSLMLQPDLMKMKTGDLFVFGKLSKYKIIKNHISPFARTRSGYVYDNGFGKYVEGGFYRGFYLNTGYGYWLD